MAAELSTLPDPAAATPDQMHALLASVYKKTGIYLRKIKSNGMFSNLCITDKHNMHV